MKMESMYEQLGVSAAVYEYGERIIAELRDRFDAIDQTAEYNQAKVLSARPTAPSTTMPSVPRSTSAPSSSPSSAPRATPPAPASPWSRSGS